MPGAFGQDGVGGLGFVGFEIRGSRNCGPGVGVHHVDRYSSRPLP